MAKKLSVLDVIRGLAQAASNAYDGSHDKRYSSDGEEKKVGLKREEGDVIVDSRVMDGFKVKFSGSTMIVTYHGEVPVKQVLDDKFETEIENTFNDIVKYLRKEYKTIKGENVTLTSAGDANIFVQNISRIRTWVQASKVYKIGNLTGVEEIGEGSSEDRLDQSIRKWLAVGKDKYPGAKKPQNVKI